MDRVSFRRHPPGAPVAGKRAARNNRQSIGEMVREERLDLVLVPLALAALVGYHLWLLYAILRHPAKTVIGLNAIARKRWVAAMIAVGT